MVNISTSTPILDRQETLNYLHTLGELSQPKFGKGLIFDAQGALSEVFFITLLWEKIKGLFGGIDHTESKVIAFHSLCFLSKGLNTQLFNSNKQIDRASQLASRAGLIPSGSEKTKVADIDDLIKQIALHLFHETVLDTRSLNSILIRFYNKNRQKFEHYHVELNLESESQHLSKSSLPSAAVLQPSMTNEEGVPLSLKDITIFVHDFYEEEEDYPSAIHEHIIQELP